VYDLVVLRNVLQLLTYLLEAISKYDLHKKYIDQE